MVLENPWIHEWSIANLFAISTEAHRANWQPVVLLSHTFDIWLFGYNPGPHHLVNLAFHVVNAYLIYCLTGLLIRRVRPESDGSIQWIAFLTAAIFVIHPQHVESVAWVVERKDVLYALFTLSCLITYVNVNSSGNASLSKQLLSFALFCVAIAAKPMAVTLPALLVFLDIYPLNKVPDLRGLMHSIFSKIHYWLVSAAVIIVTLSTQSMAMPGAESLPLWAKAINAVDNSVFYIYHYIWPVALSPFYPYPSDANLMLSPKFWAPGLAFLALSTLSSFWLLSRGIRWPFVLLGFYLVTLLPVSGLIHVGPAKATDHYVYLATIPFSLLTAMAMVTLYQRAERFRFLSGFIIVVYLGFLLAFCVPQVKVWNNHQTLWSRVLFIYPDSAFGHRNLAAAYVATKQWDKALWHAERSLELGSPDEDYVIRLKAHLSTLE